MEALLNTQCGLLGISGVTNDMKVLLQELLPISPDIEAQAERSRQTFAPRVLDDKVVPIEQYSECATSFPGPFSRRFNTT